MHGCRLMAAEGLGRVALPVKALKAGQETYWLDQIARNREEYFSGRGESPGRFVGRAAHATGLEGTTSPEQVRAMFQGLDPATGELRCAPLLRADPRSKLAAGPLLEALTTRAAEQGVEWRRSPGPRRSRVTCAQWRRPAGWAGPGGSRWRQSSGCAARSWAAIRASCTAKHSAGRGSIGASGSTSGCRPSTTASPPPRACRCWLPAAATRPGGRWPKPGPRPSRSAVGYLERHGVGVRRDHNGTDRYQAIGGW